MSKISRWLGRLLSVDNGERKKECWDQTAESDTKPVNVLQGNKTILFGYISARQKSLHLSLTNRFVIYQPFTVFTEPVSNPS